MRSLFLRHRTILVYGLLMGASVFVLKWLEFQWVISNHRLEVYTGAVAFLFTILGIWIAMHSRPIVVVAPLVEEMAFQPSENVLRQLQLSARELEVLDLIAQGFSNQEIADKLFVSLNTVKSHCSHVFEKLEVSRRTQAVEKAKKLALIR